MADKEQEDITKALYERNVELAIQNKTLSLIRKLYQISILTLDTEEVADKITDAIRQELDFELVGIHTLDESKQNLHPLKFARSDKFIKASDKNKIDIDGISIANPFVKPPFQSVLNKETGADVADLSKIWQGYAPNADLLQLSEDSHIKTCLLYPLITKHGPIGVLTMCMNRPHASLSRFEKESIESFIGVIAICLDRAFIYGELKIANIHLQELSQQKSEFLSFASHDLKSPINIIKQFATLIADGTYKEPKKVQETIAKIKSTADRATQMVDDFLDIRKIEEGRLEYNPETKDIVSFVKDITDDYAPLAKGQKNIDMSFITTSKEIPVRIDTIRMRQVIQNLLSNSLKYTEASPTDGQKNWIKVMVTEEQSTVLITIKDSGMGMSAELLPTLFEQFHRDKTVAKKIQGTGLGLYISKQIVLGHAGETWAQSDGQGKGSTFFVRLKKA